MGRIEAKSRMMVAKRWRKGNFGQRTQSVSYAR
jgi:hypothetical protein